MKFFRLNLSYYKKKHLHKTSFEFQPKLSQNDFTLTTQITELKNGNLLTVQLIPRENIIMKSFKIIAKLEFKNYQMLVNGFQSWSESFFGTAETRLKCLDPFAKVLLKPYGDFFHEYSWRAGVLHSHTYTYFKESNNLSFLIGSLDETTGYTIFKTDFVHQELTISKDCHGLKVDQPINLLQLYYGKDHEAKIWDSYTETFDNLPPLAPSCTGWTSWYNYYTKITEEIILENLTTLREKKIPLDYFQIDDGYQMGVGDWLAINEKFPHGMKYLATEIKKSNYSPGLWLAPFVCEKNSRLFKEHSDWLLRNRFGRPIRAGWNPGWSGFFYALDFDNPEFREYLREVFHVVLDEWGFEMVKLDFLYAAGLIPKNGRPRAQVMLEAMSFLRELVGKKKILGCGIPIAAAFGKVDYCRIGSDVAPYWEDYKLKDLNYRERVSTISSLHNTITRVWLNNRVFVNDPDVFMLREENNQLTQTQKETLFLLNNLCGGLVFFSDNINNYSDETLNLLKLIFPKATPKIIQVKATGELYQINCQIEARHYLVIANLSSKATNIKLPPGIFFENKLLAIKGESSLELKPYETKCFHQVSAEDPIAFLGSTGHLFSGAELATLEINNTQINLKLKENASRLSQIYFLVSAEISSFSINQQVCSTEKLAGFNVLKFTSWR